MRKKWVESLFVEGLDKSICDNMRVYLGQYPPAPLTGLARYADKLIKISDRSARTPESLKSQRTRSTKWQNWSYAHAILISDDVGPKSTLKVAPKSWNRSYEDKRQLGSSQSGNKTSYCRVCLVKTHSILQCPYLSKPSDFADERRQLQRYRWYRQVNSVPAKSISWRLL